MLRKMEIPNGIVWNIENLVLVIWICFGFRVSSFSSPSHSLAGFAENAVTNILDYIDGKLTRVVNPEALKNRTRRG